MFLLLALTIFGSAYEPTPTLPWPTRKPRLQWPTETEEWGQPPTEFPPEPSEDKAKITGAMIAAIVIGSAALVIIIVVIVILIIRQHRKHSELSKNTAVEKIDEKLLEN